MRKLVEAVIETCGSVEIVVHPTFYELEDDEMQRQWDACVTGASRAGFYLVEALIPDADPRHTMHIERNGTEHHYLMTPAQAGVDHSAGV